MPALSSPSVWRTHPQTVSTYLYLLNPDVVLTRRVNQSSFTYPVVELTYDDPDGGVGDYTDVEVGQTLQVLSSAGIHKGFARVKSITATTLGIGPVSRGDITFEDNDRLVVLNDFRLWSKIPHINNLGIQFKDYDRVFLAVSAQPPVANAGPWYARQINADTNVITVDFDGTSSFAVAEGASISTYLWDVRDGTIIAGSTGSSQITATFPAGYRWVSLTVTDSNGNSHTAYTLVVAADENTALRAAVTQLNGSLESGWTAGFQVLEADVSEYPLGTPVICWAEEKYGSTAGSLNGYAGRAHIKFCGWLTDDQTLIAPYTSDWAITAQNAYGVLQGLPAFSQTTERAASPASWYQVAALTWWRHVHYLMMWHSTLLDVCDVERPAFFTSYDILRLDADAGTVTDQLKFAAEAVAARFTIDHVNRVYFRRNPHLMNTSDRSSLTTIVTLQDTDWVDRLDIPTRHRPQVNVIFGAAVIASAVEAAACKAAAPGTTPGQGGRQDSVDRWLVASQSDLNERLGRLYALQNIDEPRLPITVLNGGLVADPAWQEWIKFTTTAANTRGKSYTAQKFVLTSVSVRYEAASGTALETWELEKAAPDTVASAITVVIPGADPPEEDEYVPSDGTYDDQFPIPYEYLPDFDFIPEDITTEPTTDTARRAIGWSNPLQLTLQAHAASPAWTELFSAGGGNVVSVVESAEDTTYPTGGLLKLWALTDAALYVCDDALAASPTFDEQQTLDDYRLLRNPASDGSAVVVFAEGAPLIASGGSASASSQLGGFTADKAFDGILDTTIDNRWSSGNATPPHWLEYDFGASKTVTAYGINCIYTDEAPTQWKFQSFNGSTWDDLDTQTGIVWTEAGECQRFILASPSTAQRFRIYVEATDIGWCSINELLMWETDYGLAYSDDDGATLSPILTNPAYGDMGGDVDDFNLGIIIHAAKRAIVYTTAYMDTIALNLLNLTGISAAVPITCVRIPYRKLASQVLNNDITLFQFIYGLSGAVGGATLWGVTFNTTDGSIAAESDMTPIVSGTTYYVVGPHALETAGANTQHILAFCKPVGGGATVLLKTTNGGTSWAIVNSTFDGDFVRWIPGSTSEAWVSGPDGIGYTANAGTTIQDRTGDFSGTPLGAYGWDD